MPITVEVPAQEFFDERREEFINTPKAKVTFEHSLVSISKWEAEWEQPFFGDAKKTNEQLIDYIRCMTITQNVPESVYYAISHSRELMKRITDYCDKSMTATTIRSPNGSGGGRKKLVTSELIYFYMFTYNVPMECQKWHINRLMMLLRVCAIESNPNGKKMSKREVLAQNAALNAARRKKLGTRG